MSPEGQAPAGLGQTLRAKLLRRVAGMSNRWHRNTAVTQNDGPCHSRCREDDSAALPL